MRIAFLGSILASHEHIPSIIFSLPMYLHFLSPLSLHLSCAILTTPSIHILSVQSSALRGNSSLLVLRVHTA